MVTDLTVEHPKKTLWKFVFPMFISVMFQQFYNIADSMIAGRFAGEEALAAVGASYPVTVVFMAFAVGSNLGTSVLVSGLFGGKQYSRMKSAISTAFIFCSGLSIILTVLGIILCNPVLRIVNTPENIFGAGALYLKIYVFGVAFVIFYNVCTGIFTALGDSKTPLYFLIGSSVFNIVLDYVFVAVFSYGVSGVAWATFVAQGVSAVLAFIAVLRRVKKIGNNDYYKRFDTYLFGQIIKVAVPSIMQQSVLSVGSMFVQGIVNEFGSGAVAGFSVAIKLNTFAINSFMSMGGCLSSYTAQNIGAGKGNRITLGFKEGLKMSFVMALPFFLIYFFGRRFIINMFLTDGSMMAVISGMDFLKIVSPWYFMIAVKLMTDGVIRGAGKMGYFVAATIPDLILRIILAKLFSYKFGSTGIWMAWPFGWIATTVLTIIFYRNIVKKYKTT